MICHLNELSPKLPAAMVLIGIHDTFSKKKACSLRTLYKYVIYQTLLGRPLVLESVQLHSTF